MSSSASSGLVVNSFSNRKKRDDPQDEERRRVDDVGQELLGRAPAACRAAAPVRWVTSATMAVEKTRPMATKIQKGSTSVLKWLLPERPQTQARLR